MSRLYVRLRRFIVQFPVPPSLLFWIALQIPVFAALSFLYTHRPVANPTAINYDVHIYFKTATATLNGQLPYRDFFFQYPPLALLFFVPPRLVVPDLSSYFTWFNIELLVLVWVGLLATASIARRIGQRVGMTLLVYSLALLAIGSIIPQRYDLAPAVLVVLALAAWLNGRHGIAYALLAVGTLTKVYPALLLPLLSIAEWRGAGLRAVGRGWLIFGGLILVVILPFLLLAPQETLNAFSGQAGRGMEIASVYASLMLVGRAIGIPAQIVYQPDLNSWNVTISNGQWPVLAASGLQLGLLALVYLRFWRAKDSAALTLLRYSAAIIGIGLLTSKVLSAQYILWLFPLAFLSGDKRFAWASALFLAAALLTQLLFPFLWSDLKQGTALSLIVALGRDLCLGLLCVLLLQATPTPIPASRATLELAGGQPPA